MDILTAQLEKEKIRSLVFRDLYEISGIVSSEAGMPGITWNVSGTPGIASSEAGMPDSAGNSEGCLGKIQYGKDDSIVITDSRPAARLAAAAGYICVGLESEAGGFFDGAELVCKNLNVLDRQVLEETLLHAKGRPVKIAETERLVLREISQQDIEGLCRISRQDGMEYLMCEGIGTEDFFNPESLKSYIAHVYRFYGYGLWSVFRKDGTLIGCCGLQDCVEADQIPEQQGDGEGGPISEQRNEKESDQIPEQQDDAEGARITVQQNAPVGKQTLELQYMLDRRYWRQGFGTEMCRAALGYAFARTDAEQICIRCHPENTAACALAQKLGFRPLARRDCNEIRMNPVLFYRTFAEQ